MQVDAHDFIKFVEYVYVYIYVLLWIWMAVTGRWQAKLITDPQSNAGKASASGERWWDDEVAK